MVYHLFRPYKKNKLKTSVKCTTHIACEGKVSSMASAVASKHIVARQQTKLFFPVISDKTNKIKVREKVYDIGEIAYIRRLQ